MALRVATHAHRGGPGGAGHLAGMPILANLCPGPPFAPFSPEQAPPRPRAPPGSSPPSHSRPVPTFCPKKGLGESSPHTFALTLRKAGPARQGQATCPAGRKSAPGDVLSSCSHLDWHQGPFALKGTLEINESTPHVITKRAETQRGERTEGPMSLGWAMVGVAHGLLPHPPQLASPECAPRKASAPAGQEADGGTTSIPASPFPANSHKGKQKANPHPLKTKTVLVQFVTGFSIGSPKPGPGRHLAVQLPSE